MTELPEHFRISSALKSIIGKDLITDDFIAVFELVKNSFDADAKRVDIYFEDSPKGEPRIVIVDDGRGMGREDILNKYLFVAYSEKKKPDADYRDKITARRIQAGAKGIGRFSCDRLGASLQLYSKTKGESSWQAVTIDWSSFDSDMSKEFASIPVSVGTVSNAPRASNEGTVLQIDHLRTSWDREKLLSLKRSLEKLVNPNQANDPGGFKIFLHAPAEISQDDKVKSKEPWEVINGEIKNFVFEALKLKTTRISSRVTDDGDEVITTLMDRGRLIYELREENLFRDKETRLHSVSIHLFALNRSAKNSFTRYMGIPAVQFGSVFLYKNGFRIHPFGSEEDDSFGISRRKQQGSSRYLGTRDLIGRVEINGMNKEFQETSSRDGGLIRNGSYYLLQEFVLETLKRLEKFVIGVIKWGNTGEIEDWKSLSTGELKSKFAELIIGISSAKGVRDIRYDSDFLDVINDVSEKSLKKVLKNFGRIAEQSGNESLAKEVKRAETKLEELGKAADEAQREADEERAGRRDAEKEARRAEEEALKAREDAELAREEATEKTSQNLFLHSVVTSDVTNILSLHHHVGIAANTIENHVKNLYKRLQTGKPTTPEMIMESLQKISFQARQIDAVTKFATKANFNAQAAVIDGDLIEYLREYVLNVSQGMFLVKDSKDVVKLSWEGDDKAKVVKRYRPLELAIVVDNLISNARKAGASTVRFIVSGRGDNNAEIKVVDNGQGFDESKLDKVFDLGYSSTNGSGLGLFHIKKVISDMGGKISACNMNGEGAISIVL